MEKPAIQKIKDALAKANTIGIVVGQNPTLDQMAGALSLYLSLKQVNKKAVIASPSNPIVEISSLVGIDKVQTKLGGDAGDLVVSFPYAEGEIEKVSYTLENEQLNIIVKAGENGLNFDEKDVKFIRGSGSLDLLFIIGTPHLSQLGDLISSDQLKNVQIVNIDNKAENQGFGDIVVVSPRASSVSEQVGDIILDLGFAIDQDVAQNLLSGIISSTSNFQDPKTSALAFEVAGIVMQKGAIRNGNVQAPAPSQFIPSQQEFTPTPRQSFTPAQPIEQRKDPVIQRIQDDLQIQQNIEAKSQDNTSEQAPIDWLSPKVYKGSSNV